MLGIEASDLSADNKIIILRIDKLCILIYMEQGFKPLYLQKKTEKLGFLHVLHTKSRQISAFLVYSTQKADKTRLSLCATHIKPKKGSLNP
jgi:hypothetical protein